MRNKIISSIFLIVFLILIVLSLTACWDTGKLIEETIVVDLKFADRVAVTATIYKGDISISGENQTPLLISNFSYNLTQWTPKVTYTVDDGGEGHLKIVQKENTKGLFNPLVNDWLLLFNEAVPIKLDIMMGSGQNQLDLSSINLINLKIVIGNGDTTIDLTGDYQENVDIYLVGGIGHTVINLPKEVGVRLMIQGGLNRIRCDGFNQIGNFYYNSVFNFFERKIFINLISGLGIIDINLLSPE